MLVLMFLLKMKLMLVFWFRVLKMVCSGVFLNFRFMGVW